MYVDTYIILYLRLRGYDYIIMTAVELIVAASIRMQPALKEKSR